MVIKISALILLFVACLVRSSTAGTCVRIQDAPDADIHINTCENTPQLQYSFTESYMTVTSSLESCQTAEEAGSSTSSVYFNEPHYMEYHYQHTFEYTIMVTDVDSHCVVTLMAGEPKNMTDQNGLTNDPKEDISKFAMNQWYTRKFRLNSNMFALSRFVRVGLTCAVSTPINDGVTTQTVLIRDIRFVSNSYFNSEKVFYNYQVCASGCDLTTIDGAQCMPKSDGSAAWTFPSDLTEPIIKSAAPLVVLGSVQTSNLWLASSMNITSCLKAMDSTGVTVHLPPGRNITIYHQVGCMLPRLNFDIDIAPEYTGVPITSPYITTCPHQFFPENVVVTMDLDRVTFFAGSDTVKEMCREAYYAPQVEEPTYDNSVEIALVVVFSVVGAVGVFLAVFFGIRKIRQRKSLTGVEVPME